MFWLFTMQLPADGPGPGRGRNGVVLAGLGFCHFINGWSAGIIVVTHLFFSIQER